MNGAILCSETLVLAPSSDAKSNVFVEVEEGSSRLGDILELLLGPVELAVGGRLGVDTTASLLDWSGGPDKWLTIGLSASWQ